MLKKVQPNDWTFYFMFYCSFLFLIKSADTEAIRAPNIVNVVEFSVPVLGNCFSTLGASFLGSSLVTVVLWAVVFTSSITGLSVEITMFSTSTVIGSGSFGFSISLTDWAIVGVNLSVFSSFTDDKSLELAVTLSPETDSLLFTINEPFTVPALLLVAESRTHR